MLIKAFYNREPDVLVENTGSGMDLILHALFFLCTNDSELFTYIFSQAVVCRCSPPNR